MVMVKKGLKIIEYIKNDVLIRNLKNQLLKFKSYVTRKRGDISL